MRAGGAHGIFSVEQVMKKKKQDRNLVTEEPTNKWKSNKSSFRITPLF